MKGVIRAAAVGVVLSLGLVEPVVAVECPDDSVASGTVCMDKYEASVWYVPPEAKTLIKKIQNGKAGLADLVAAGAVQLGLASGDMDLQGCPFTGNGCVDVYAVSIPGVTPAGFISWFQAVAAARNSLKRLPTSQEWLAAALGTPDGGPCNVGDGFQFGPVASTGSQPGCVSDVGTFDMVGNLFERVADWGSSPGASFFDGPFGSCFTQSTFGSDLSCGGGPTMMRGGAVVPSDLGGGTHAGVFAVRANFNLGFAPFAVGFRCVR